MPVQRLSGLDAAFLYLETPSTPMHTMAVLLLGARRPPLTIDSIRSLLLERMHHLPALRQRVLDVPFGLDHPVLVDDPDFDIHNHLWHIHWDEPGTLEDVDWAAGALAARLLDRRRPLWQACWFDELEDGGSALVFKVHHALIDGVSSAEFMGHLMDTRPVRPADALRARSKSGPDSAVPLPRPTTLAVRALQNQTRKSLAAARGLAGLSREIRVRWRERPGDGSRARTRTAADWLSPPTHFNGSLSRQRAVSRASASLEEFRVVKQAFDSTVNDVLLAAVSLAFARYFSVRGGAPARPLRAAIPVSTRGQERSVGGNRVSTLFVDLPIHLSSAESVIRAVRGATRNAKRAHAALPAGFMETALEYAPPPALKWIARQHERLGLADRHRPLCNLIVSNFPGPQIPLYCAGASVRAAYPYGPLMNGSGLNLTVMSYNGRMDLGLISCPRRMPEAAIFVADLVRAVGTLCEAAQRVTRPSIRPVERKPSIRRSARRQPLAKIKLANARDRRGSGSAQSAAVGP